LGGQAAFRVIRGQFEIIFKEKTMKRKRLFWIIPAAALAFGVMACGPDGGDDDVLAGTVWNGRRETPASISRTITDSKFTWDYNRRYATALTLEGGAFSSGQSLAETKWSGMFGNLEGYNLFNMTLEFVDETRAEFSWEPHDYATYTLDGNTIHFNYMEVREGTLAFKENSTFQFDDRNTTATGTYKTEGGSITLSGVWLNGDAGAGTTFELSGTISGGTITLTDGVFWGIRIFNNETEPWYPKP
jgi:hypothetical protein